jgi:CRISPR-associated endonuclease/helicase Cas3
MSNEKEAYSEFFSAAFSIDGRPPVKPFDYQCRLALEDPLPSLVNVPTGAGKTAAVLGAWLWRRVHNPSTTGRRLIYCLPMRTLVEQTRDVARAAIKRLGLESRLGVYTLMGGDVDNEWEHKPERGCILVGTQDMLLSRALNRGYALSRFKWPVHFGFFSTTTVDWLAMLGKLAKISGIETVCSNPGCEGHGASETYS